LQTLSAKDAKCRFGRLIGLVRAKLITVAKHGHPVVVAPSVGEYERLKSPETPKKPLASEERK